MEMAVTISLRVSIDGRGANLNEICAAARQSVVEELTPRVVEAVIEEVQVRVLEALVAKGSRQAHAEWGSHEDKRQPGRRCRHRSFRRQGYRSRKRRVRTDVGEVEFRVGYLECTGCGKRVAPILQVLRLEPRASRSAGLERVVCEAVAETSYRRGEAAIEARGSAPVPRSSAHRWVAGRELPESPAQEAVTGMADATAFKKHPGERGQLRVVLGLDGQNRPIPLGCYAGQSWQEIGRKVARRLRDGGIQLELFTSDGELGLDEHLASRLGTLGQRCTWHMARDLYFALAKSKASSKDRQHFPRQLAGLVGIELPEGSWEAIRPEDKEDLVRQVAEKRAQIEELIADFRTKRYWRAVHYLERALGRIFAHVELWLETGIVAPRTTSVLENILRELGRRIKKLGYNWGDKGAAQMSNIVMLRRYDPETWEAYWRQSLKLHGRCRIRIEALRTEAA